MTKKIYVYCKHCQDSVDYIVKEMKKEGKVKGNIYEYIGKEAFCIKCGSPVLVGTYIMKIWKGFMKNTKKNKKRRKNKQRNAATSIFFAARI